MEPISFRTPLALLLISLRCDCGRVVVAGHADHACARADRSQRQTAMRVLCAVPRRADPADPDTHVSAEQIEQDLTQLAKITECVRTYSIENGLDQVPALAAEGGAESHPGNLARLQPAEKSGADFDRGQADQGISRRHHVARRRQRGAAARRDDDQRPRRHHSLGQSPGDGPVTYADVWEYWLRNREIYDAVDFVTIHILPYWEDFPIRAKFAAAHVDAIRRRMAVAFPGKEILIGETGWPSEGRMREGALPSRTNQARVVSEILDLAKQENFRVNLIEAYDQPWKRQLEGTVGGYWGLFDSVQRALKYPPGEPISNFPFWKLQMGCGMALERAGVRRRLADAAPPALDAAACRPGSRSRISATSAGILLGVAADKMFYESYGFGGWLQWGALLAAGIASPLLCANAADVGPRAADIPGSARAARRQKPGARPDLPVGRCAGR